MSPNYLVKLRTLIQQRKKTLGYVGKNSLKQNLTFIYDQILVHKNPAAYCQALLRSWLKEGYLPNYAPQGVICLNLDLILTQAWGRAGELEQLLLAWEASAHPRFNHLEVGWFKDRAFYQDYH